MNRELQRFTSEYLPLRLRCSKRKAKRHTNMRHLQQPHLHSNNEPPSGTPCRCIPEATNGGRTKSRPPSPLPRGSALPRVREAADGSDCAMCSQQVGLICYQSMLVKVQPSSERCLSPPSRGPIVRSTKCVNVSHTTFNLFSTMKHT